MNTNQKSAIAIAKVISSLTEQGFDIFVPLSDSAIDIVAIKAQKIYRLQVKYSGDKKLRRYVMGRKEKIFYDINDFDYYAAYLPEEDVVVYVPLSDIKSTNKIKKNAAKVLR